MYVSCVNRLVYHGQLASTYEGRVPPFSDVDHACTVTRVPLGVCALVTPWNHPLLIAVKKVSVALATGNCVVVKPPEVSPCSVLELGRILKEAGLPDGVRACACMFILFLINTVSHSVLAMKMSFEFRPKYSLDTWFTPSSVLKYIFFS